MPIKDGNTGNAIFVEPGSKRMAAVRLPPNAAVVIGYCWLNGASTLSLGPVNSAGWLEATLITVSVAAAVSLLSLWMLCTGVWCLLRRDR